MFTILAISAGSWPGTAEEKPRSHDLKNIQTTKQTSRTIGDMLQDELGGGISGVGSLQGTGLLALDSEVKWLQS